VNRKKKGEVGMSSQNKELNPSIVLLVNGIVDIGAGLMLIFFPLFGITIPDYGTLHYQMAFAVGGWGIAALTLGIARVWASRNEKYRWYMIYLGFFEGTILTLFCVLRIAFSPTTFVQAAMALAIGLVFAVAYGCAIAMRRTNS
jgi:hypothetical protein